MKEGDGTRYFSSSSMEVAWCTDSPSTDRVTRNFVGTGTCREGRGKMGVGHLKSVSSRGVDDIAFEGCR